MSGPLSESARAAFRSRTRLRILLLCEEAPQTSRTLVAELGTTRSVVIRHLAALEAADLIREVRRESVHGGSLASYRTVAIGWAVAVALLNELSDRSVDQ